MLERLRSPQQPVIGLKSGDKKWTEGLEEISGTLGELLEVMKKGAMKGELLKAFR